MLFFNQSTMTVGLVEVFRGDNEKPKKRFFEVVLMMNSKGTEEVI